MPVISLITIDGYSAPCASPGPLTTQPTTPSVWFSGILDRRIRVQRSLRRWLVCWQRWRRGDFFARGSGILSWLSSACGDRFKQQVNDGLKHGMAQGRELSALILLIFLPVFGGQTIHRTWQNCHFLKSGFLLPLFKQRESVSGT